MPGSDFIDSLYIVAPGGEAAAVLMAQMASAGWHSASVGPAKLIEAIRSNSLGAAILTTAALEIIDHDELRKALAAQPTWSDCPLILLSSRNYMPLTSRRAIEGFGNVTVLEHPELPSTLVTAVATALRTRSRQRQTEAFMQQREDADAKVRSLAATLEVRVVARTMELTAALAEREATEERLRRSEERYRLTVELSSQIPWTASPDFHVTSFGKAPRDASEVVPVRNLRDLKWDRLVHRDEHDAIRQSWREASRDLGPLDVNFRMRIDDGSWAWHRARAHPDVDSDGKIQRWYGTLENIDAQRRDAERLKQLQTQLIHVSRVSAMGAMASTLAHELNQPLTAVANYLRAGRRLLAAIVPPVPPAVDSIFENADRATVRAGEIVRRLRAMVMLRPVNRVVEDAVAIVRESCELALIDAALLGVSVRLALGNVQVPIVVDSVQLQQVMFNILRNAVEAMHDAETRILTVGIEVTAAHCIIKVGDSGPGIAPEAIANLFSPFNSTKSDGMGIGLSISRTIIEAHDGEITAVNRPEGGAEFALLIPLAPDPA